MFILDILLIIIFRIFSYTHITFLESKLKKINLVSRKKQHRSYRYDIKKRKNIIKKLE